MSVDKKRSLIIALVTVIIAVAVFFTVSIMAKNPSKEIALAIEKAWEAARTDDQPAFLTKLDELSSYKLSLTEKEDGRYVIEATVTSPDLGERLAQISQSELLQLTSEEEINDFLCEQIDNCEIKKSESFIYVSLIDGEYRVSFSDSFVDAMSGRLYSYSKEAADDMLQMSTEGDRE